MTKLEQINGLDCTPSGLVIVESVSYNLPTIEDALIDMLSFDVTAGSGNDAIDKMIIINTIAANSIINNLSADEYLDAVAELAEIDPYQLIVTRQKHNVRTTLN